MGADLYMSLIHTECGRIQQLFFQTRDCSSKAFVSMKWNLEDFTIMNNEVNWGPDQ